MTIACKWIGRMDDETYIFASRLLQVETKSATTSAATTVYTSPLEWSTVDWILFHAAPKHRGWHRFVKTKEINGKLNFVFDLVHNTLLRHLHPTLNNIYCACMKCSCRRDSFALGVSTHCSLCMCVCVTIWFETLWHNFVWMQSKNGYSRAQLSYISDERFCRIHSQWKTINILFAS